METIKNIKRNSIILLIITIIVLFFLLKDNLGSIVITLSKINLFYLLIAILLYFIYITSKAYIIYKSVNEKDKLTFKEAVKHNVITQFFNGITPFSTGGQPMEVYMIAEHGIKVSKATSVTIENFIFYQTALVIYGVIAVACNWTFNLFPKVALLQHLVLLGFIINVIVAVALYVIMLSKTITGKVSNWIITFLGKIKIIKNIPKAKAYWDEKLEEFHGISKDLLGKRKIFIFGVVINFIGLTCLYIIPLFITYGLHDFTSLNPMTAITSSAYVLLVGSFVPIPGASGGIEYSFVRFFGNFMPTVLLNALLIVWRFITYYFGMILGGFLFSTEKESD